MYLVVYIYSDSVDFKMQASDWLSQHTYDRLATNVESVLDAHFGLLIFASDFHYCSSLNSLVFTKSLNWIRIRTNQL